MALHPMTSSYDEAGGRIEDQEVSSGADCRKRIDYWGHEHPESRDDGDGAPDVGIKGSNGGEYEAYREGKNG